MKLPSRDFLMNGPLVLILIVGAIGWVIYQQASKLPQQLRSEIRSDYLEGKKEDLKGYIKLAENAIKHLRNPESAIPIEEAKNKARKILSDLKYTEEDGYFFVYDFSGRNIVHPIKKDWVDENKWDYQDKEGKFVIRDLIAAARNGNGFDEYIFHKPSVMKDEYGRAKIAYVIELADWEWVLGTGIYLEDIDKFLEGTDTEVLNYVHTAMFWIAGIAIIGIVSLSLSQRNMGKIFERQKIGADLHDQVKQDLVYVIRELNNKLEQPKDYVSSNSREFLEKIRDPAQHALDWIRIIIDGKDPNNPTLVDGLKEVKKNFELKEKVYVNFFVAEQIESCTEKLSKEKTNTILKVANEAFHNISKHAAATKVELLLQADACNIVLCIHDNGIGFDTNDNKSTKTGLGLNSMRNRIREIDGKLILNSSNQGTTIKVTVPQNHNLWSYILCLLNRR